MEDQQNFNLKSALESLFFIANRSLNKNELAKFCGRKIEEIEEPLNQLIDDYQKKESGIKIIQNNQEYQMVTNPNYGPLIQKFLKQEINQELTPASLETLSIIAYRGPIRKSELEQVRGVNCSIILRNLMIKGLIKETAQNDLDQIEDKSYCISLDFLKYLGINEIKELPNYYKLNNEVSLSSLIEEKVDEKLIDEVEKELSDE